MWSDPIWPLSRCPESNGPNLNYFPQHKKGEKNKEKNIVDNVDGHVTCYYSGLFIHKMKAQSKTGDIKFGILPKSTEIPTLDERHWRWNKAKPKNNMKQMDEKKKNSVCWGPWFQHRVYHFEVENIRQCLRYSILRYTLLVSCGSLRIDKT